MGHPRDGAGWRPVVVTGGQTDHPTDHRVAAVLEVLGGQTVAEVAQRWSVDGTLLHRWVRGFVDAGTAQVTNRPEAALAHQRDRFLAAFAHEIRTPLAVAQGWVAMLRDDDVPREAVAESVDKLHDALGRLAERTRDVELLAAASLGRLHLRPGPVTVGDLTVGLAGLGVVQGEGAGAIIHADADTFSRVLRDLWLAAASRPAPRTVRLHVASLEHWIEVRVVRTGEPIDPQVLLALFDPFDLNDDGTGVTIGLYLARALAVAHGGTIGVEQDDDGAAFWVRIPCSPTRSLHHQPTPLEDS